jgi:hypothetical protein
VPWSSSARYQCNPLFLFLCYWIQLQRGLQQTLQDACA